MTEVLQDTHQHLLSSIPSLPSTDPGAWDSGVNTPNLCPDGADSLAEDNKREVKSDFSFVDNAAVLRIQGSQLGPCFTELTAS